MTKSTSPAANAGLPAIDRRALVCGLGTASIAGVPALASTAPDDPIFQAMAALEQLKIHAEELYAAHMEGLRVAANTHIEPEIDMIQIMDVSN